MGEEVQLLEPAIILCAAFLMVMAGCFWAAVSLKGSDT